MKVLRMLMQNGETISSINPRKRAKEAWNKNTGGRAPTKYGSVGAASPIQQGKKMSFQILENVKSNFKQLSTEKIKKKILNNLIYYRN